jgi:exopolysaccharide biosynthesis polyprenyl glycosylphosphotransferase
MASYGSFKQILGKNWRTTIATLAIVVDVLIVAASFISAGMLMQRGGSLAELLETHQRLLIFSMVVFPVYFTSVGLYRTISYSSFQSQAFRAGKAYIYSAATILCTVFLLRNLFYTPAFLILFFLLFPSFYLLIWALLHAWMNSLQREGLGRWNTLAIGSEPNFRRLLSRLRDHPELGYYVTDVIRSSSAHGRDEMLHIDRETVERIVDESNIGLIVLASPDMNGSFEDLERLCRKNQISMRVVSPESDYLFSKVRLSDIAGIPLYSPERRFVSSMKRVSKRIFDLVVASLCLVVFSPVFLIVAIAAKLESPGPVFFKQLRSLGDYDQPFQFYKFRSMHAQADDQKNVLLEQNESDGILFKMRDDPRLTRIGKRMRRHSIDELPQLINVIKGDMSLVGPRPLPVGDYARLQKEDHLGGCYRQRSRMKPGMTGLWQISGRSELGFREMIMLDLYYIENQSILFDIEILLQTIPVVLFGRGAY